MDGGAGPAQHGCHMESYFGSSVTLTKPLSLLGWFLLCKVGVLILSPSRVAGSSQSKPVVAPNSAGCWEYLWWHLFFASYQAPTAA